MITIESFGDHWGRLGNQLFQIALLFAVRERRGYEIFLPRNGEPVWDCFDLDIPTEGPASAHHFWEGYGVCNFDPAVFEQPDGTGFGGYYQSYRYHDAIEGALPQLLPFDAGLRMFSAALLRSYRKRLGRPLVSVHVRRGDYLDPDIEAKWGNLERDGYYQRAVDAIGDEVAYVVFSDDVDWCRRSLDLGASQVEFAELDPGATLCTMAGCDVNVVANSSFSWWGAYLNKSSDVYAPSRWYGPGMPPPNDRQDDIIPPGWRTIPVYEQGQDG